MVSMMFIRYPARACVVLLLVAAAFAAKYSWMDGGKYVSHAAPAAVFLQYATDEPFLNGDLAKQYFEIVSEPKKLKIYDAPHALNAEATRDRIAFLAEQLSFEPPAAKTIAAIPALVQPPWPKPPQWRAQSDATRAIELRGTENAENVVTFANDSTLEIRLRSRSLAGANPR
jgi:hypothetical protein